MRFLNNIADRMLGAVAPKATAGACIPPDPWYANCYCKSGVLYQKHCSYNCAGTAICGACYSTTAHC